MHHANLEKLKSLRLFGMAAGVDGAGRRGRLDFDDQLALLIERETADAPMPLWRCGSSALICGRRPASRTWI